MKESEKIAEMVMTIFRMPRRAKEYNIVIKKISDDYLEYSSPDLPGYHFTESKEKLAIYVWKETDEDDLYKGEPLLKVLPGCIEVSDIVSLTNILDNQHWIHI